MYQALGERGTVHRPAPRDGDAHRQPAYLGAPAGHDRRTVEIVHGLAVGVDWMDDDTVVVRFHDLDYVYIDDAISVRIEVCA